MERYVRFIHEGTIHYGKLDAGQITVLDGDNIFNFKETAITCSLESVQLICPCTPSKILGVGFNYKDTVMEDGKKWPEEPLIFLKSPSSIILNGDMIVQWPMVEDIASEAELAVVVGKTMHRVAPEKVLEHIWGYTLVNDVTAKNAQKTDGLWTRAKSFDTFMPIGSQIVRGIDPHNLEVRSYTNGVLSQCGNTKDMLFDVEHLVSYMSEVMTLFPGDIILTGTPGGYGSSAKAGDRIRIEIENVGWMENGIKQY